MDFGLGDNSNKQRIIQEFVPGKQITLAHIIARPVPGVLLKLGLDSENIGAVGILTITPGEATMILGDLVMKSADISIGYIDRFNGSLVIMGELSAVDAALRQAVAFLGDVLKFSVCPVTKS